MGRSKRLQCRCGTDGDGILREQARVPALAVGRRRRRRRRQDNEEHGDKRVRCRHCEEDSRLGKRKSASTFFFDFEAFCSYRFGRAAGAERFILIEVLERIFRRSFGSGMRLHDRQERSLRHRLRRRPRSRRSHVSEKVRFSCCYVMKLAICICNCCRLAMALSFI